MTFEILQGLFLPFIGTCLGSACVYFMRNEMPLRVQKMLSGFAAGVMIAASVWSLLIPAMEQSESMGKWAFIPAAVGFLLGILFLLALDEFIPHLHADSTEPEGPQSHFKKTTLLVFAITLHNIPEGMAVGITLAGWMSGHSSITLAGAMALALGIMIQNIPEGAIVSMPLKSEGKSKSKAFVYGALSGIVEPIAAGITILLATHIMPILPYLLSFAAGAMVYVVVEESIPEASQGHHSNIGTISFAIGFVLMMVLDVALG